MENDNCCIYIPIESFVRDISEMVTEAILLLDPTSTSGTFIQAFSLTSQDHVIQAQSILMSASMKSLNMMMTYERDASYDFYDKEEARVNQLICETVAVLADMYRALIVSSYLHILKNLDTDYTLATNEIELETDSEAEHLEQQFQVIQRCIVLLQSLSLIVRQNEIYRNTINQSGDWHDDFLPPPQHALLQDCFLRKDRVCIEDGIVFGKDDRQISLDLITYTIQAIDKIRTLRIKYKNLETIYERMSYAQIYRIEELEDEVEDTDTLNCSLMNPQQLELEENLLFQVAFPEPTFATRHRKGATNHKPSFIHQKMKQHLALMYPNKKRKRVNGGTHAVVARLSKEYNLGRFLWNQYMFGPIAILKKSWLRFQLMDKLERNFCILYASGLLLAFTDDTLTNAVTAYVFLDQSSCKPVIGESTHHFQLEHVLMYNMTKVQETSQGKLSSILIYMDDVCDDTPSLISSWVQEISLMLEYISMKKENSMIMDSLWPADFKT